MPDALSSLKNLQQKYNICIVSHGYGPNLRLKEKFVKEVMPSGIKFVGVSLKKYADKSCVDMHDGIFIDDSLNNVLSSNAQHKILFGKKYPWNIDGDTNQKKYFRCYNWRETLDTINKCVN